MKRTKIIIAIIISIFCKCKEDSPQTINPLECSDRANFRNFALSEYVLPFPVGKSYILSQSFCNAGGGHKNQLAYDFALLIGDTVCAIQSGIVKETRRTSPDDGGDISASDHNYIMIEHADGTVAFYAHLKQDELFVYPGDNVKRGEPIALSGNSGNTLNFPHLHIGLYEDYPPEETWDMPIVFINTDGPLDFRGGLIKDSLYTALSYQDDQV